MMARERYLLYLTFFLIVSQISCAIPVMPTGGPVDEEPPTIIDAFPESESVNISTQRARFLFSEYIEQASFFQALSITPEFDTPPQIRWRKKEVEITFPEPLRENTTYILTLDTNLRDNNRVALKSPITIAFATGPTINKGRIQGIVAQDLDGKGVSNFDIYAYPLADSTSLDSLPEKPAYRTQSNTNGGFSFEFMSEQAYYIIALQDRNRNRKPDANERFAVPPEFAIFADSSATPIDIPWLVTTLDTIPPSIQRVRNLSNKRLGVRFDESIKLISRDFEAWTLQDSSTSSPIQIKDLYLLSDDPKQIYLVTDSLPPQTHRLAPANVTDSSNNPVVPDPVYFTPTQTADTLQTRFLGFLPKLTNRTPDGTRPLGPNVNPGVRLNQPITQELFDQNIQITDTSDVSYPFSVFSPDGVNFSLNVDPSFPKDAPLRVSVLGNLFNIPDTSFTDLFSFISTESLGELSGLIEVLDSTGTAIIQIYQESTTPNSSNKSPELIQALPDSTGVFKFSNLVDKTNYKLRAFLDKNANNDWDGGQIFPYLPAEPVIWYSDSLRVRARWEQNLSDTLRIPSL